MTDDTTTTDDDTTTERDDSSSADDGGGPSTDDGASNGDRPKRRRRGRRGRGRRGRGGGSSATADGAEDDATTTDASPDAASTSSADHAEDGDPKRGGSRSRGSKGGGSKDSGSKGGGSKGGGSKGSGSKGGGSKGGGSKGGGSSDGDAAVAAAIEKGGTRMAAKRGRGGRGRGGGGGGGSRRNGGGGRRGRPQGLSEEERQVLKDSPPRTMLVTTDDERTQIAVMEDRTVVEQYVTRKKDVTYVGNIYMGRVQNVLPGMEAAFIDIGKGRNGVLYAGEVLYDELDLEDGEDPRIENALKSGQTVLVQVTKDPMGSKGPRLTMNLSLAGRYMVLAPNTDVFGISRKLTDKERERLRRIVKSIKPDAHGVIVRTAASGAEDEAIEADLERLLGKWEKVERMAERAKALEAVYTEPQLVVKVIRDNFGPDYVTCIVDDEDLYGEVVSYLDEVAPDLTPKVHLYKPAPALDDKHPEESLFDAYHVTEQLKKAMDRKVGLPSGGYLIIETTEAMKVIDVNTGRFTGGKGANLEQVVLKTNLEAAEEIVRQLRLRDLGGIVVIDFIDMLLKANQDQVVRKLKRELLRDRTKTRVSDVSRLGLVQMTRKNVSQGLVEAFSSTCEHCKGRGYDIHDDRIG